MLKRDEMSKFFSWKCFRMNMVSVQYNFLNKCLVGSENWFLDNTGPKIFTVDFVC